MTNNRPTGNEQKGEIIAKAEAELYRLRPHLKPDPEKGEAWLAKDCEPYVTQKGEEWHLVSFTRLEGPKYSEREVSYGLCYDAEGNIVIGGDEENAFVLIERSVKYATKISGPGVTGV